jgi:ribulose-phosphate 3-epimerase
MRPFIIAPSILSADLARLGEQVERVLKAGADWIHFDVMDNHFVPDLTFGPMVCRALREYGIKAPIDVHLMVEPIDRLISMFVKAGATSISFHPQASENIEQSLQCIRDAGCQAGLAINPDMPLDLLPEIADKLDLLLLMSVNPGRAGQNFIPSVLEKIKAARQFIDKMGKPIRLEVDGGIYINNIEAVALAGADTFVAGSAIFGDEKPEEVIKAFRAILNKIG